MTEPTQEQLRTEAYWRSTISAELYAEAENIERTFETKALGVAVSAIVAHIAGKVGQMPDRRPRVYDREPPADVTSVCDREGDEWCRTDSGWVAVVGGGPLDFPELRDSWGPITSWPGGGA
ncbi:hypothetical protein ABGB07_02120 [Micromonosporaceae bacterium B7E4]